MNAVSEKQKILVVDDDQHIAELISLYLMKDGYDTQEVYDGRQALEEVISYAPDMILLDLMLPGMDGYQVCAEVRKTSKVPIIMLTAKGETFDKVLGLELGADDYIVKPFDPKELVARVKAVLRRYEAGSAKEEEDDGQVLRYPDLEINLSNYTVMYHGKNVDFPPKEFELLHFLASNPKRVFTREQLLDRIWGYEYAGDTRTVDVHVKRIREKLNQDDEWGIRTVWSVGYKFGPK
ncbi:MAG: response regulator transcription factor [Clostridia bacterium]|nr:response regulator transcription factor [Clostridia bacterium]